MRVCSIEGCDKPFHAKDLCSMHHARSVRYGDPTFKLTGSTAGSCEVEGCEREIKARRLCEMHLARFYRTGSPLGRSGMAAPRRGIAA